MNFPCRVMVDLALHEADLRSHTPEAFDETNEDNVAAVVPYELVGPIHDLLGWRGAASLPEELRHDLEKLYSACAERWRDI